MPASRSRRILLAAAALLAGPTLAPAGASAAASFSPCASHRTFECATVDVPLDRSGGVAGTVGLHVERQRGTGGRSTAWIGLAGGPGQSAASLAQDTWLRLGSPVAGTDQILTFDQRGTGDSGLVDCASAFNRARSRSEATRLCGEKVGAARPFYTTTDSVEDIEAVREAVGADTVVLVGVSYGTYVALRYARTHPDRTAALVLDSTVPLQGVDQWQGPTYGAIPGALQKLCAGGACPFTRDTVADLRSVAARLQSSPRGGIWVSDKGRRSSQRISSASLVFNLLLDGDFNPQLRAYIPGALTAARAGDWAPLVRLVGLDYGDGSAALRPAAGRANPQAEDSDGVYLATTCSDSVLPWAPSSAPAGRGSVLQAATGALSTSAFLPFARATVVETSAANRCFTWPATAAVPYTDSGAPLAPPTLILSGGADLRTPTSEALRAQSLMPGATLLRVAGVGHYVLGNDPSGCAVTAYTRFLTGVAIDDPCATVDAAATTLPRAPLKLGDVPVLGATGTTGEVVRIAARTMVDALASTRLPARIGRTVRIGGLRGGRIVATFASGTQRVTLSRVEYLRGIRVSGTISSSTAGLRATLKVDGGRSSRRGTIKIVDAKLSGTIGGRRVSAVSGRRGAHTARAAGDALTGLTFRGPGVDIG